MDLRGKAHRQKHYLGKIICELRREQGPPLIHPGFIALFFPRDVLLTMCSNVLYPRNELKDGFLYIYIYIFFIQKKKFHI